MPASSLTRWLLCHLRQTLVTQPPPTPSRLAIRRWFRVVKSDLSRRSVQHDDGLRSFCISVMQVTLLDKVRGKGVVSLTQGSFDTLDLWAAIEKDGFASLLRSQILWNNEASPMLSLTMPALGDSSAQLAPARPSASSGVVGGQRRRRVKMQRGVAYTFISTQPHSCLGSVHSSKSSLPCGCLRFYGSFDA